jgi:hypothetical protein
VHATRAELYAQADLAVQMARVDGAATESALITTARVVAALAAKLAADDTKQRLRRMPLSGSVKLDGGSGPARI